MVGVHVEEIRELWRCKSESRIRLNKPGEPVARILSALSELLTDQAKHRAEVKYYWENRIVEKSLL